ncbi:adenylyltransferase/cytidyltransferase family protein [Candidatus Woesearchaeota archaeon]|jgi:cytidyltransferase-like protein|nr:adenylyltransferase/cytidyltransferase family protein [Candidatus Woesearchaeota archaeon]MBT4322037.1 adenylyltransferase/cytidyltransferase family protein [Candidatus Woesearchaeota archaeon]MBT4630783.1 adenylyltransferase/cytidyltransferase family protein [Candidatus Woesearchaeota archaeon]
MEKTIVVSGGFDPVHIGHVRMFKEASQHGKVIIILNNDNWIKKFKREKPFMPEKERIEILEAFEDVSKVLLSHHKEGTEDISVSKDLRELKPDIFANGGDRKTGDVPLPGSEHEVCEELGIKMLFNMGRGGKVQSSSELIKNKNLNTN